MACFDTFPRLNIPVNEGRRESRPCECIDEPPICALVADDRRRIGVIVACDEYNNTCDSLPLFDKVDLWLVGVYDAVDLC